MLEVVSHWLGQLWGEARLFDNVHQLLQHRLQVRLSLILLLKIDLVLQLSL